MKSKNNFKKGSAEMLMLHILKSRGDCYGYEICQLIAECSDGILTFPEGSMYPALYKAIDAGYITDYKKQVGKRLTRVYYHIEPSGERHFDEIKAEYFQTNESIKKVLSTDFSVWGDTEDEQRV